MSCETIQKIIPDYVKNIASEQDSRMVEEHLCICHTCRDFLGQRIEDPAFSTRQYISELIAQKRRLGILDYIAMALGLGIVIFFVVIFVTS